MLSFINHSRLSRIKALSKPECVNMENRSGVSPGRRLIIVSLFYPSDDAKNSSDESLRTRKRNTDGLPRFRNLSQILLPSFPCASPFIHICCHSLQEEARSALESHNKDVSDTKFSPSCATDGGQRRLPIFPQLRNPSRKRDFAIARPSRGTTRQPGTSTPVIANGCGQWSGSAAGRLERRLPQACT